jgi:SPP1 family predicted phage head-tail adaptor
MTGKTTRLHIEVPIMRSELQGEPVGEYARTGRKAKFKIVPLTGREYVQAQQVQSNVTHELKCPYFSGANSSMRLTAGEEAATPSRIFNVESVVNEKEQNRFLVWRCVEVT